MSQMLMVVLGNSDALSPLLESWQAVGVPGVTILRSAGVSQTRPWPRALGLSSEDTPLAMAGLTQRTLIAIIEDDAVLAQAVAVAERVVGGFAHAGSGLLVVLPVNKALGVKCTEKLEPPREPAEASEPDWAPEWRIKRDTSVAVVAGIMDLQPTIVRRDDPLDEVARAMLEHPAVHVACVACEDDRLLGLIDVSSLANDLFFHILPEEFLGEISDLEHAMQYADFSRRRTAADAMRAPAWLRPDETVKEAFRRMHDHRMPGLPVVDEASRVVGYVNLLELLAICIGDGLSKTGE